MGADQSRPSGDGPSSGASSTTPAAGPDDFYTLLEVDDGAGELEIKKSFRKLALKWHPDKNPTRLQESTLYFSKLQEAYETLSDPQERAYYDRRRQQSSLRTEEPDVSVRDFDDVLSGRKSYGRPVKKTRGLGVRELERFFDKGVWRKGGMSDSAGGFYQIYATLFAHLSQEEALHAAVPQPPYPPFGDSTTPWSLPDRTTIQGRNFYNVWSGFSTEKSFEWVEQWDAERGDVRHVRRMMEKDNKKARDDAKREYNETVRTLVAYLRKRDPRVPKATPVSAFPTVGRPTPTSGSRTPAKPAAAGPPPPTFTPQEWQRATASSQVYSDSDDETASGSGGEGTADGDVSLKASKAGGEWECIICGRSGKSEGRWRDHERSKGHRRELDRVRREMLEEDWELGLGEDAEAAEGEDSAESASEDDEEDDEDGLDEAVNGITLEDYEDEDHPPAPVPVRAPALAKPPAQAASDSDDEQPSAKANVAGAAKKARKKKQREEREAKLAAERVAAADAAAKAAVENFAAGDDDDQAPAAAGAEKEDEQDGQEMSKKDKRRERERKKAEAAASGAAAAPAANGGPEACNICKQSFSSRTKLFDHIKKTSHASLKAVPFAGKGAAAPSAAGKTGDWSSDDDGPRGKKGKKKGKR